MFPWGLEIHGSGFRNPCRQFDSVMRLVRSSYSGTLRPRTVDQTFTNVSEARFCDFYSGFHLIRNTVCRDPAQRWVFSHYIELRKVENGLRMELGLWSQTNVESNPSSIDYYLENDGLSLGFNVSICQLIIIVSSFCGCWEDLKHPGILSDMAKKFWVTVPFSFM